ncbi:MAG TPA: thiolase family protein [Coleofasciculaceae cyanobacterium]|jgi:acetyl-CoA C-acetyltransferase
MALDVKGQNNPWPVSQIRQATKGNETNPLLSGAQPGVQADSFLLKRLIEADTKTPLLFGARANSTLYKKEGFATKYPNIWVLDGRRTPFGDAQGLGKLKNLTAEDLGVIASKGALQAAGIAPEDADASEFGTVITSSKSGPYNARDIGLRTGLPYGSIGNNYDKLCGSGMYSLDVVAGKLDRIQNKGTDALFLAGGTESMSRAPFSSYEYMTQLKEAGNKRQNAKNPVQKLAATVSALRIARALRKNANIDLLQTEKKKGPKSKSEFMNTLRASLTHTLVNMGMLDTAENLRELFRFADDELDAFSLLSQHRAGTAIAQDKYADEIVSATDADGKLLLEGDEGVRGLSAKIESLLKLRKRPLGEFHNHPEKARHSAANASRIVDGAAAMVMTNEQTAARWSERTGLKPLGKIIASAEVGVDPNIMGYGAVQAAKTVLKKSGLSFKDIDLIEINEAFASVALAAMKDWEAAYKVPLKEIMQKTNVNGGAIAIGHPLAATGSRLVITMLKELQRQNKRYGLVTACIGGGQGIAMIVENPFAEGGAGLNPPRKPAARKPKAQ